MFVEGWSHPFVTFPNFSLHGVYSLLCVIIEVSLLLSLWSYTLCKACMGLASLWASPSAIKSSLSARNPRPRCVEDEVLIAPQPPPPGGHGRSDLLPLPPPALGVERLEVTATAQLFTTFSPGSCKCRPDSRIPKHLIQTIPACSIVV